MLHCIGAVTRGAEAISSRAHRTHIAAHGCGLASTELKDHNKTTIQRDMRVAKACGGFISPSKDCHSPISSSERVGANEKIKEKTLMAMPQHKPLQNLSSQQQGNAVTSNETVKLIRKLRWIGMEEEAKKLQRELSEREEATADSVVATPRDTD